MKFLLTTGHGEHVNLRDTTPPGFSDFTRLIERLGFEINHLGGPVGNNLPNLTVLAIIDPDDEFSESEREAIFRFVHEGGSLLIMGNGREKSNEHTVNSILVPLFGVKLNPDQVSDRNKNNQYRDRYEFKAKISSDDFKELLKDSFFEVIDNTDRLIATISSRRLVRNRAENSGADKTDDETPMVISEMKKLLNQEFEIMPLPPVCPYPDVVETTIEKNTIFANLFVGVHEISYAFGCSLSIERKKMEGFSSVIKSNRNCEPSKAPLLIMGNIGQGKVAIIGSKDMFSNDASFGLYVSNNSGLAEGIVNWLAPNIFRKPLEPLGDVKAKTDESPGIEIEDGKEEIIEIGGFANDLIGRFRNLLLNDVSMQTQIQRFSDCLENIHQSDLTIRADRETLRHMETGILDAKVEEIAKLRRIIDLNKDTLQQEIDKSNEIVERMVQLLSFKQ